MFRNICIGLLIAVAALAAGSCARDKAGDVSTQEPDRVDRIDDAGEVHPDASSRDELFPATETGRLIRNHLEIIGLPAENLETADRNYRSSLAELRSRGTETAAILATAYDSIETSRYVERWEIVKTLADIEVAEAYQSLSEVALAPIPPERSQNLHHYSTQEQEAMIRLRAIEGLALLAAEGQRAAEEDLRKLALEGNGVNTAIQLRAIKAYLRAGSDYDERVRYLKNELPANLHGIVTLDVTPREEFEARVKELATVAGEDTTGDNAEEPTTDDGAPTVYNGKEQ